MEAWRFCFIRAKRGLNPFLVQTDADDSPEPSGLTARQVGTILAAIKEIAQPEQDPYCCLTKVIFPGCSFEGVEHEEASTTGVHLNSVAVPKLSPEIVKILKDTAFEVADSRTDDIIRTTFAVFLYILQVVSSFVTAIGGGNNSPPGGRIGTAMLLTWLIPVIMLSNSVGGFASRRSCFRIVGKMVTSIRAEQKKEGLPLRSQQLREQHQVQEQAQEGQGQSQPQEESRESVDGLRQSDEQVQSTSQANTELDKLFKDKEAFFSNQRWKGGSDIYCPEKFDHADTSKKRSRTILGLSISPVLIAFIFGAVLLQNIPPYGFNCRSIMVLAITLAWLLSAWFTHVSWKSGEFFSRSRNHWYLVFWKDVFVAVPSVLLIFFSSVGLFNTCYCWSMEISKGPRDAHVPLNVTSQFEKLDKMIYPILVSLCLFLQFISYIAMRIVGGSGFKLMRWPERKRQMEFLDNPPESLRYRIWQFVRKVWFKSRESIAQLRSLVPF
jgi:hypothetical protein